MARERLISTGYEGSGGHLGREDVGANKGDVGASGGRAGVTGDTTTAVERHAADRATFEGCVDGLDPGVLGAPLGGAWVGDGFGVAEADRQEAFAVDTLGYEGAGDGEGAFFGEGLCIGCVGDMGLDP